MSGGMRNVVVSGLPGSGKSTLAHGLSPRIDLPIFDKDDFLESLFRADEPLDAGERTRLSRQADVDFRRAAERAEGGILVSFWRRSELSTTSGTPTEWLSALRPAEVFCVCPPSVAAQRFITRRRAAGHGDGRKELADVISQFEALAALGPLGIGPLVSVDTSEPVALREVVEELRRFSSR